MQSTVMLSACYTQCHIHAECHYGECHYGECHYGECHYGVCHYAECRGAVDTSLKMFDFYKWFNFLSLAPFILSGLRGEGENVGAGAPEAEGAIRQPAES